MTSSTNEILEELKLKLEPSDHESAKFFQENGLLYHVTLATCFR